MNFPPQNITGLPEPDKASAEHSRKLATLIHRLIREKGGEITFREFMELALYAPAMGYYVAGQHRFGADGDFVTAPELGDVFGRCLAKQLAQIFQGIEGVCEILEYGAGSGRLAVTLLEELARLDAMPERYLILETSPDLRQRQQHTLKQKIPQHLERVIWLDRMPEVAISGVILANEVLDAMPVEMFAINDEGVAQQFLVKSSGADFQWDSRQVTGELAGQIEKLALPAGYCSELNPAVVGWLAMLSDHLKQGIVMLFDYGFPQHEYYHPQRTGGTLMCHYRHHSHSDPLTLVGIQDITAHVDFTAVAEAAIAAGLDVVGFTTQSNFLLGSGLVDVIAAEKAASQQVEINLLKLNHEVQLLTSPAEMGELFKVMALAKQFDHELNGFSMRDMRGRL